MSSLDFWRSELTLEGAQAKAGTEVERRAQTHAGISSSEATASPKGLRYFLSAEIQENWAFSGLL